MGSMRSLITKSKGGMVEAGSLGRVYQDNYFLQLLIRSGTDLDFCIAQKR